MIALLLALAAGGLQSPAVLAHEPDAEEVALGSLVDAELAFARTASERGVRAALLANLAADGVVLEPNPVRPREARSAPPPPADRLASRIERTPAQAGVARSHDLGFTTGPFARWSAARAGERRHGVFFAVWQRNGAGKWEVILDAGIGTPGVVDFATLGAAPRPQFRRASRAGRERLRLLAFEANALGNGSRGVTPTRYAQVLSDDVRLYRDGAAPLASRGVVAPEVARRMLHAGWMPLDGRVSAAGDMALTYGRYREADRTSNTREGYYAHLWLRDEDGTWRLAYDIALAAAP